MKILAIGPEGTGKTVFLTMLTGYMSGKSCPSPIHVETFKAAENIEGNQQKLKSGNWPPRNNEGTPHEIFTFRLGHSKGKRIHLWDFPGEHFRKSTIDPSAPDPLGHLKKLREAIEEAHMLIYLLDMGELLKAGASPKFTEDAWLFREFLTNSKWKRRQRLVVVTKADLYRGLIDQAGGDVRKMIIDAWPEDGIVACPLTPDSYQEVAFFAVTSVKVKTVIGKDRVPRRMPRNPLESEGFDPLVRRILEGLNGGWWTKTKNALLVGQRGMESGSRAVVNLCRSLPRKVKLFVILVLPTLLALGIYRLATDEYEFKFVTSETHGAGTDGAVVVSLQGENGRTTSCSFGGSWALWRLDDPFERNQSSCFYRRMKRLGKLERMQVQLEDFGEKPAWTLSYVQVTNLGTGDISKFPCNQQIGTDFYNPGIYPWVVSLSGGI